MIDLVLIAHVLLAAAMLVAFTLLIVGAIEMFREEAGDPIAVMRDERKRTGGAV